MTVMKVKKKIIIFFVIFAVILIIYNKSALFKATPNDPVEKDPTDASTCVEVSKKNQGLSFELIQYSKPQCSKIIKNIIIGKWKERKYYEIEEKRRNIDKLITKFRVNHEGFSKDSYRRDELCGFHLQNTGGLFFWGFDASSWCRPDSPKPCCTNALKGICVSELNCPKKGVNLANYLHAELSDWVPNDESCKMALYDQKTACSLLFHKQVRSIGFVGNSLLRNFYSVMLQMLTNNYHNGSVVSCIPPSIRKKCVGYWQNWDKYCLTYALASSSEKLPGYGICDGHLDLRLYQKGFWMAYTGNELKTHVSELLGISGTYLLVGIGAHDHYNHKKVINKYLKPSFDLIKGHNWPKFVWVHPLKSGIFKPPGFFAMHGSDDLLNEYVYEIDKFCSSYNILTLDFRSLTTGVWSVDGTHYGTGVNKMKIQIFLNLLASNQVF